MSSAREEAAGAEYKWIWKDWNARNETLTLHALEVENWVSVRHENPQKLESKWFGPYQIFEKKLLGIYRLIDPNARELYALIQDNRLIKMNIRTTDELRKLWSSPTAKDSLRKINL